MKTINFITSHNSEIQSFNYRFEDKTNETSVKWTVAINLTITKSLHKSKLRVILYFIGLFVIFESCAFTWIGRSIGGDIGNYHLNDYADARIVKVSAEKMDYGGRNHIEVHKTDSSVLTGIFRGFTTIPSEKYNQENNLPAEDSASQLANLYLPGELLFASISNNSGYTIQERIKGSYPHKTGFKNRNSSFALSPDHVTKRCNSEALENQMDKSGNFMESNKIPHRRGVIILDDKLQKMIIPLGEIAYARCQRSERNGKLIGAAVGILLDAAIVIVRTRDEFTNISTALDF